MGGRSSSLVMWQEVEQGAAAGGRRAAVVAVVVDGDHVLVIRRSRQIPGAGYWAPPSGKVEFGEDEAAAVVREVQEEVGLSVFPLRPVWKCISADGKYDLSWWLAASLGGDVKLAACEVSEAKWILPEDFGQLAPTYTEDREFFAEVLPGLPEWRNAG